jgi:nucleoside-diphosphate-sugar epimerase
MKIAMTGASGHLGSKVYDFLSTEREVLRFGRRDSEVSWALGQVPEEKHFEGVSAIFHFAWSLRDHERDFDLNVNGTRSIALLANKLSIPFVFVSSTAVFGISKYGDSKLAAERIVSKLNGVVLRIGVIPNANRSFDCEKSTFFQFIPAIKSRVHYTEFQGLTDWIESFLNGSLTNEIRIFTVTTGYSLIEELYSQNYRIRLYISEKLILFALTMLSPFFLSFRNMKDSISAIRSTPKVLI